VESSAGRRILLLLGPTAVGKTDVAMALFDRLGGSEGARLISVDSTMVYRGMDIGSAKPSPAQLERYPHALIDIRHPAETYTVADFVSDADAQIRAAFAAGQLPILVGGTMLYAKRFVEGIAALPVADPVVRAELEAAYRHQGGLVLHNQLAAIDPAAAANIHPNNSQRLIRALEVVRITGQALSDQWDELNGPGAVTRLGATVFGCAIVPESRSVLHARIAQRFAAMLDAGFVAELEQLRADYEAGARWPSLRAVGYRQGLSYLAGECDLQTFRDQATTATRRLAKRQMTWLRSWPDLWQLHSGAPIDLADAILKRWPELDAR